MTKRTDQPPAQDSTRPCFRELLSAENVAAAAKLVPAHQIDHERTVRLCGEALVEALLRRPETERPKAQEMSPADVVQAVRLLSPRAIEELAQGPLDDPDLCRACGVLDQLSMIPPGGLEAATALARWHTRLVGFRPGHGPEQDPTRVGMIYGAAAALLEAE